MANVYLYLLHMTGTDLYKIGISVRPCKRLESINGRRQEVKIVRVWYGLDYYEKELHRRYAAQKAVGANVPISGKTEWFRLSTEDVNALLAACYLERLEYLEREKQRARARFADV